MKKLFSALFVLVILSSAVFAQSISVGELAKILNNENVVIIDARAASDYAKTHIKGSVNLDVETLSSKTPIEGILNENPSVALVGAGFCGSFTGGVKPDSDDEPSKAAPPKVKSSSFCAGAAGCANCG